MISAGRTFELDYPVEAVWKTYSDAALWASWFDMHLLVVSSLHRFYWQGQPGPGVPVSVEINGQRVSDWLAKEWDPPLRFKLVGLTPGFAAFSIGLSLTRQTDASTIVDLKLNAEPLGRVGRLFCRPFLMRRKLESMALTAHRRVAAATA